MRGALVLRPEPGGAATAARLAAHGITVRRCPLFAVTPVAWTLPAADEHDALLLTSANAVRHAGGGLAGLGDLPVLAVGGATAAAATAAGLKVALTGTADAEALLTEAHARGWRHPLHLTGRDHGALTGITAIAVYDSAPRPIASAEVAAWTDHVALLHSPRAARRFAALIDAVDVSRDRIAIAALSPAVGAAAGTGWRHAATAAGPRDDLLVAAAAALIDRSGAAADKRA